MGRLWEYESRTSQRDSRRADFTRSTQTSGFHKMLRDSLISRGLDPDIIPNLSAPPSVTKPVDREVVKDVVPSNRVQAAETALQTRPRTTFIETEDPEKESGGGFLKRALGGAADIAGDVLGSAPVKVALSILDVADIPRREVGKPIARALLEPLALATEAADAISPDNLSVLPRIFPTGGQLRGATAVEVLSFITDPINLIPGIGFTKMVHLRTVAKVALKGGRLSLKDTQLLRKATPVAQRMLIREADEAAGVTRVFKAEGSDLMLPRGYKVVPHTLKSGADVAYMKEVGGINITVTRNLFRAEERRRLGGRELLRPAIGSDISVDILRTQAPEKPLRSLPEVLNEVYTITKANPHLPVRSKVGNEGLIRLLERAGFAGEKIEGVQGKRFTFTTEKLAEVLGIRGPELAPSGVTLTGPQAARKLIGGDLPGIRALSREEAQALTAKVPIHESNTVKNLRNTVAGEGHNPPPPPPPPPPPKDDDEWATYKMEVRCLAAGFYWWEGACHENPKVVTPGVPNPVKEFSKQVSEYCATIPLTRPLEIINCGILTAILKITADVFDFLGAKR